MRLQPGDNGRKALFGGGGRKGWMPPSALGTRTRLAESIQGDSERSAGVWRALGREEGGRWRLKDEKRQ